MRVARGARQVRRGRHGQWFAPGDMPGPRYWERRAGGWQRQQEANGGGGARHVTARGWRERMRGRAPNAATLQSPSRIMPKPPAAFSSVIVACSRVGMAPLRRSGRPRAREQRRRSSPTRTRRSRSSSGLAALVRRLTCHLRPLGVSLTARKTIRSSFAGLMCFSCNLAPAAPRPTAQRRQAGFRHPRTVAGVAGTGCSRTQLVNIVQNTCPLPTGARATYLPSLPLKPLLKRCRCARATP